MGIAADSDALTPQAAPEAVPASCCHHAFVDEVLQQDHDGLLDHLARNIGEADGQTVYYCPYRRNSIAARNDGMRYLVQHEAAFWRLNRPYLTHCIEAQTHMRRQARHRGRIQNKSLAHATSGRKAPGGISPGVT